MPTTSVKGLRDLEKKLNGMKTDLAIKTLRGTTMSATLPVVKALRAAAPVGKTPHKTYKGSIAMPGYLSRSIRRRFRPKGGKFRVEIGVLKTAFYGVLFVESGTAPHVIPKQAEEYAHYIPRRNGKGHYEKKTSKLSGTWRKKALKFNGRYAAYAKHPGTKANPWFKGTFIRNRRTMIDAFTKSLNRRIKRIAKHGK